jgi:hypothetical protein
MTEMELRMLRHLAGVMAEAAAGIIAIIDSRSAPPDDLPEPKRGPAYLGANEGGEA